MLVTFAKLTTPLPEIAAALNTWENDPLLVPLIRPNRSKDELEQQVRVTVESLTERMEHQITYLMYVEGELVGEMNYQIDPRHLLKRIAGTAWIAITIGEAHARGKGVGAQAMSYLEDQIREQGLKRIELGVFEFNASAIKLYKKMGYQEIGRIDDFTYWHGKIWQDIRMEKYLDAD